MMNELDKKMLTFWREQLTRHLVLRNHAAVMIDSHSDSDDLLLLACAESHFGNHMAIALERMGGMAAAW